MKIGIIVEGGGMKCAHSAGVLDGFLDEGFHFDYGVGVSAGAANLASFLAGQRDRNRRFYTDHSQDKRYLSVYSLLTTGNYFGLQYIYGTLTNEGGDDPLDYNAMMKNPTEMYFPGTDAETGRPHFFSKEECTSTDYRPIMATCALPVVTKPIEIDGHFYYDGGVSDSIPLQKALDDGCDKLVVLSSKPRDFVMQPQKYKFTYTIALKRRFPAMVEAISNRYLMYNKEFALLHKLEAEGKAFVFHPSGKTKISTYTKDSSVMQALYDEGLQDAKERAEDLRKFMQI